MQNKRIIENIEKLISNLDLYELTIDELNFLDDLIFKFRIDIFKVRG